MRAFDANFLQFNFQGLVKESGCTYEKWVKGELEFLDKLFYYTNVGQLIHKKYNKYAIGITENISNIIK